MASAVAVSEEFVKKVFPARKIFPSCANSIVDRMIKRPQKILRLLVCCATLAGWGCFGQGFGLGNYQVVSNTPLGGSNYEFLLRVSVTNQTADAQGVTAQVFSTATNTVIISGLVICFLGSHRSAPTRSGFSSLVQACSILLRSSGLSPFSPCRSSPGSTRQRTICSLTAPMCS
jgi:hypothetical protein